MSHKHDQERFERVIAEDVALGRDSEFIKSQISFLADWYDKTPSIIDGETLRLWGAYAYHSAYHAGRLTHKYRVGIKPVWGQPYAVPEEMFADIEKGVLKISLDNSLHPILSKDENFNARIWHDLTHYEIHSNFGFMGEWETCNRQTEHVGKNQYLTHVLFCDIVGQVAWGLVHREFPLQKVIKRKDGLCGSYY